MHFLQRMVAKAVSEALTQAMNRKLQKQTDELVQENEDSTGGAYHFLVSGYYRGLQMKIFSVPMIIALLICLAGMTLSGQTDVVLESIMAVLIVVCITLRIVSQKKMQMIAYRKGEILFMDRKDTVIAQIQCTDCCKGCCRMSGWEGIIMRTCNQKLHCRIHIKGSGSRNQIF